VEGTTRSSSSTAGGRFVRVSPTAVYSEP